MMEENKEVTPIENTEEVATGITNDELETEPVEETEEVNETIEE